MEIVRTNQFDQISRVEIRKNIADAFIVLESDIWLYPQDKRKELIEKKASQMKSEINEFIDRLAGTVGEENEIEGQKNTMGATIRLQGSEEYVKRMQEIMQLNQSLEKRERSNCLENSTLIIAAKKALEVIKAELPEEAQG